MKFTTTAIAASAVALTSALPAAQSGSPGNTLYQTFKAVAYFDGESEAGLPIQAYKGGLRVDGPPQGNQCGPVNPDYAVFSIIENGDMYLYTPNPPQQLFVDRSGMGQGVIGYTQGVQPIGRNQERGPFSVTDEGDLVFGKDNSTVGFQACPNALGGGYSIWLQGVDNPGGNSDCKDVAVKVEVVQNALKCVYTQS